MKTDQATYNKELIAENEQLRLLLKRANENSNHWYKNLFNHLKEAMVICETSSTFPSTIIDCNDEFLKLIKGSWINLIGRDFMDLMRKGEKQRFFIQAFNKNKNEDLIDLPFVFIAGDGTEINMEISTRFFESSDRQLLIITLSAENTYRSILNKGIEQLLSNSNQVFFSIKEENTLIFDYISFSVYKVTGYSSSELKLNPIQFWNNCHPEDLKKIKRIIRDKARFQNKLDLRFIRNDGQMIWLEFSLLRNDEDNQYYAVARETTALQKQKRLSTKKDQYDQTMQHVSQMFITGFNKKNFLNLSSYINQQLQSDQLCIYAPNKNNKLDHITFKPDITLEEKTYTPSNQSLWEEFKDELIIKPILTYHSDDDALDLNEKHIRFFRKNSIESTLIIPLLHNNEIKGYLACIALRKPKRWDRTDINFISQLGQLLSIALYA